MQEKLGIPGKVGAEFSILKDLFRNNFLSY
jgi:hypothetical protein